MPQVGNGALAESAFGALDEKSVLLQDDEDGPQMAQVIRPRCTVDQNVIKKYQDEAPKKGRSTSFIRAWNVAGALHNPNGMTRNS